jgi:hypothetical protein
MLKLIRDEKFNQFLKFSLKFNILLSAIEDSQVGGKKIYQACTNQIEQNPRENTVFCMAEYDLSLLGAY